MSTIVTKIITRMRGVSEVEHVVEDKHSANENTSEDPDSEKTREKVTRSDEEDDTGEGDGTSLGAEHNTARMQEGNKDYRIGTPALFAGLRNSQLSLLLADLTVFFLLFQNCQD